jgi:hypothetical protein
MSDNGPQFLGRNRYGGTPAARVFITEGQPGGREIKVPGLLGAAPLHRTPTTPHGPTVGAFATDISPTVRAALPGLGEEKAARVRDVVTRKGRW